MTGRPCWTCPRRNPAGIATGSGLAAVTGVAAGPGFHARACAGAALLSAALHLHMAGQHAGLMAGAMLLMALMCLPCVLPLWRSGSAGAARMMMGGALAMVAVHAVLLLAAGGGGNGHQHGGVPAVAVAADGAGAQTTFTMLALVGWELAAAMLAATWLRRRDAAGRRPGCRKAASSCPIPV